MSLTRKMLKAMDIDDEKIEQIIEAHTAVTDSLKADRDKYKTDAEKSYDLERQLEEAQKEAKKAKEDLDAASKDPYKEKYETEKQAFADYKKGIEAEQTKAKKVSAYKALLKKSGVAEKHIELITKGTDIDKVELDAEGNIKDADEREKSIKEEYAIYIPEVKDEGAGTETPPAGAGEGGRPVSRAAKIVAKHNERLYGVKGEDK